MRKTRRMYGWRRQETRPTTEQMKGWMEQTAREMGAPEGTTWWMGWDGRFMFFGARTRQEEK